MDILNVTLTGNLTRDPELRDLPSGQKVVNLRVASATFGDKTVYTDVSAFDKLAELVAQFLAKGAQVTVSGRLDFREWEKNGEKRSAHSVVANSIKFPPKPAAVADDLF